MVPFANRSGTSTQLEIKWNSSRSNTSTQWGLIKIIFSHGRYMFRPCSVVYQDKLLLGWIFSFLVPEILHKFLVVRLHPLPRQCYKRFSHQPLDFTSSIFGMSCKHWEKATWISLISYRMWQNWRTPYAQREKLSQHLNLSFTYWEVLALILRQWLWS